MSISRLTISNFRCFGGPRTDISLDKLTTFVGGNACGKTAALAALARLSGVTPGDRASRRATSMSPRTRTPARSPSCHSSSRLGSTFRYWAKTAMGGDAVPECFRQVSVDDPMGSPYCRVRLDAKWARTTLYLRQHH